MEKFKTWVPIITTLIGIIAMWASSYNAINVGLGVLTVGMREANASIEEIITLLAKNRIGAVVIVDEMHRVLGIISERDIVRILATQGAVAMSEPVGEHMTRPVVTCSEHHSIDWLMEQMTSRRFRHIPVTEKDRLAGIISIG